MRAGATGYYTKQAEAAKPKVYENEGDRLADNGAPVITLSDNNYAFNAEDNGFYFTQHSSAYSTNDFGSLLADAGYTIFPPNPPYMTTPYVLYEGRAYSTNRQPIVDANGNILEKKKKALDTGLAISSTAITAPFEIGGTIENIEVVKQIGSKGSLLLGAGASVLSNYKSYSGGDLAAAIGVDTSKNILIGETAAVGVVGTELLVGKNIPGPVKTGLIIGVSTGLSVGDIYIPNPVSEFFEKIKKDITKKDDRTETN